MDVAAVLVKPRQLMDPIFSFTKEVSGGFRIGEVGIAAVIDESIVSMYA